MTDDTTVPLLSYDKEPVVIHQTYINLGNGAWLLEIKDQRGRLIYRTVSEQGPS